MKNLKEIVHHNVMSTQLASRSRYNQNNHSHSASIISSENDDNFVRGDVRDGEASDATSNDDSFVNGLPTCEYVRDSGKCIFQLISPFFIKFDL